MKAECQKFYPNTIRQIRRLLKVQYGLLVPCRDGINTPAHIMWMMEEMQNFPDTRKGSAKAGRWIGWILREIEYLNLVKNESKLKSLKKDVEEGFF